MLVTRSLFPILVIFFALNLQNTSAIQLIIVILKHPLSSNTEMIMNRQNEIYVKKNYFTQGVSFIAVGHNNIDKPRIK